jgi:hypothetical protein
MRQRKTTGVAAYRDGGANAMSNADGGATAHRVFFSAEGCDIFPIPRVCARALASSAV